MSESEVKPMRPSRGLFFYFKVMAVFVALIAVSAGIAIYYVYNRLTTDSRLEQMVMEKVSGAINMDVKFGALRVVFPGLEISNVSVATDSASLKIDSKIDLIKIRPDLWAAFAGELMIDALTIASATTEVELKKTSGGRPGPETASGAAAFDLAAIKFPFNSVDINSLRFMIIDHPSGKSHNLLLNQVELSRSMLSTAIPFSVDAVLVGQASLKVDGKLYWPASVLADLVVKAENIDELKKLVPEEYRKHVQTIKSAEGKASIKFNMSDGSL
ncbi:MAG: hypothetical protein PHD82_15805, partial [Candidatus Riflebacteria bacterium]|nr:hypothetical protein [Candidatus Riflebacteria bacterium]